MSGCQTFRPAHTYLIGSHAGLTLVAVQTELFPRCCYRTVTDVGLGNNPAGLAVAAMSVVSSGMQQIFCRTMQQKHKLSSHELLANTAPAQVKAFTCFLCYSVAACSADLP